MGGGEFDDYDNDSYMSEYDDLRDEERRREEYYEEHGNPNYGIFEEEYEQLRRQREAENEIECTDCRGTGRESFLIFFSVKCFSCKGKGKVGVRI